ncbi:MAG: DUF2240 family protein [Nanoarchaeota archaeon]
MSSNESLEKLIEMISKHSSTPSETVNKMIEDKQDELSGLVSEEGAAHIVARELGVNLLKETKRQLKIKNLMSGLRSVDIVGRIVNVAEVRDFERNGKPGQVTNIVIGDETGVVRLSLWNEEIDIIKENGLKEDETIRITGGYVKMDNRGNLELRVGRGKLEKIDEKIDVIELPSKERMKESFETVHRREINELKEGDHGEIRACIVQLFKRNPFYEVCPQCSTRAKLLNEKWTCDEHGEVTPSFRMVMSAVADDGSGNIRVVFFGETAEKLLGKTSEELKQLGEREGDVLKIYDHVNVLGNEFVLQGRVKQNSYTERLEMVANDISRVDVKKEAEELLKTMS